MPSSDSQPPLPPGAALLWDLDNVAPRHRQLGCLATTLATLVAADAPRLAAAHRTTARQGQVLLSGTGIRVLSGGRGRNGADRVLIGAARGLARAGVERFLVASNDGRFALIADFAQVHVVSLHPALISGRLQACARSVSVLEPRGLGGSTESSPIAVLGKPLETRRRRP